MTRKRAHPKWAPSLLESAEMKEALRIHAHIARMLRESDAAWEDLLRQQKMLAAGDSAATTLTLVKARTESAPEPAAKKPVGSTMLMLATLLFSPKTLDQVFEQMVADYRIEHLQATQDGRVWGARATRIRWWCAFLNAALLAPALALVDRIVRALKGAG